jgi:hypothetical protein
MTNKILIVTFSIGGKLPRGLDLLEDHGVYVHQARGDNGIIEKMKKRFDYLLIDDGLYDVERISNLIATTKSTFDIHTQVLRFSESKKDQGKAMPIYEKPGQVESLIEFVERITEVKVKTGVTS